MDRGAWWAVVHRVAKSQTRLRQLSTNTQAEEIKGHELLCKLPERERRRTVQQREL